MRILEVIPQMGRGGAERLVAELSAGFARRGHPTMLLLFYDPEEVGDSGFLETMPDGVIVAVARKRRGLDPMLPLRLRKIMGKFQPDVIHTHLDALPYVAAACQRRPIVHTVHNYPQLEAGNRWGAILRRGLIRSGRITAVGVSVATAAAASAFYGAACVAVPNGREPVSSPDPGVTKRLREKLLRESDEALILNLATTSPVKNQLSLARAVAMLNAGGRRLRLVIAGQTRPEYLRKVLDAADGDAVALGVVDDVAPLIAAADVMAIASFHEGLPITLLEAMMIGTPVVATPADGVTEVAQGCCFLADGYGPRHLADALGRMLDTTPEKLVAMTDAARHRAFANYSMTLCCDRYLNLFTRLL